jgi:DNA-binding NarL/FixJ family response regulator
MRLSWFKRKEDLAQFNPSLTRDDLIRRCRILVIDDERPQLIDDLMKSGFAIDHDPTGDDLSKVEAGLYDLILLDFGGIGIKYGKDQGLSLLRHIKRINPGQFILAYTSKSLPPEQSEFYRLTDGTLYKDAGIQESFAKIEDSLRDALNVVRLWQAAMNTIPEKTRDSLQRALSTSIRKRNPEPLRSALNEAHSKTKDTIIEKLIEKVIDLIFKAFDSK